MALVSVYSESGLFVRKEALYLPMHHLNEAVTLLEVTYDISGGSVEMDRVTAVRYELNGEQASIEWIDSESKPGVSGKELGNGFVLHVTTANATGDEIVESWKVKATQEFIGQVVFEFTLSEPE